MHLHAQRCLIIPDIHQDIAWAERILARETAPAPDLIIFLGDYFDSHYSADQPATSAETCAWLNATRARLGDRAVFLLGNHDIQYLEAKRACDQHLPPHHLSTRCGLAFAPASAQCIARDLAPGFWQAARLFVCVNDRLLSHAGLHPSFWPAAPTLDASLATLDAACRAALANLAPGVPAHPLLQAGRVRGGVAPAGGLTWLDWDHEFEDSLPLPQIVGHTASRTGARRNGRSWCLDGRQTCYGVLTADAFEIGAA